MIKILAINLKSLITLVTFSNIIYICLYVITKVRYK